MISFRIIEKLHLNYVLGTGWVSYIFVVFFVIGLTILVVFSVKYFLKHIEKIYEKNKCIKKLVQS